MGSNSTLAIYSLTCVIPSEIRSDLVNVVECLYSIWYQEAIPIPLEHW